MNILFTCAGRRNYLLKYFKGIKGIRIVACDVSIYAPALYEADEFFIVPEVFNTDYIITLLKEAKSRRIDTIIPLNDLELPVLSENKHKFENEGITVILSSPEIVDLCYDKFKTLSFTQKLSVKPIPTFLSPEKAIEYRKNNMNVRFVIKPRWGTASVGIEYPLDDEELITQFNIQKKKHNNYYKGTLNCSDQKCNIIIQRKLEGTEYGLDIINNLRGEYEATLIRKKIAMRSGETDKAETFHDKKLSRVGEEIGRCLRHIGILDCDLFIEDDDIYLLEMNPRFGGGYPFSHFAGANLPVAIVEWLKGNQAPKDCFKYQSGLILAKTDIIIKMDPDI